MTYFRLLATLLFSFLLISTNAQASRIIIEDPCSMEPWLDKIVKTSLGRNVGEISVATFDAHQILYVGAEAGINSIRNSVTGDQAIEVLSDNEMRAYGWCFSVNGVQPDEYPNKVKVKSESDIIRWFFGYAHYRDGKWISYCSPTNILRPSYICRTPGP